MLLTANSEKEFERIPAGTHIARCYLIADLGTQETTFQGEIKQQRKIVFAFETPGKLMESGKPFAISETFTASIGSKAKLRNVLENWKGSPFTPQEEAGFNPEYFLNRPCFISVVHETSQKTGKTYANIGAVMQIPEGVSAPTGINAPVYFMLDEYTDESFSYLPEWIQNKVKLSPEYQAIIAGKDAPDTSDVPFIDDVDSDIPY